MFSRIKRVLYRIWKRIESLIVWGSYSDARYWEIRGQAIASKARFRRLYYIYRHRKIMEKFGASIPLRTEIASRPIFPHQLYGIFVSAGAVIGRNCVIFQQVTIGSNTIIGSKSAGCPVIGDNVYIGCGAKIIGGIKIGNNVRIGANCIVTKDVPDNSTVVMEYPRVIMHETVQDNKFYSIYDYNDMVKNPE